MANEETREYEMTGNLVTDENLSEVQRNQQNTVEKRLERIEAQVFPEATSDEQPKSSDSKTDDSKTDDNKKSSSLTSSKK